MKTRFLWLVLGLAFFITLAVIVGQRLSAEAMAVIVGVVAGVAASIPTSLIVVWIAMRSVGVRSEPLAHPMAEAPRSDPRIVVVSPPMSGPMMGQTSYAPSTMPMAFAPYPAAPRRFTVIGGSEAAFDGAAPTQEVVWPE